MKYILRVNSDHEYNPLWYAFVNLDERMLHALRLMPIPIRSCKNVASGFLRIEYLSDTVIFCGQNIPMHFDKYVTTPRWRHSGNARLPASLVLPPDPCLTVTTTIQIEENGVRWTAQLAGDTPQICFTETLYFAEVLCG